jgi:hypothetical protein
MTEAAELAESGAGSDYIVVLRARSSARFVPEEGWELNLDAVGLGLGPIRVRAYTRWVQVGPHQVPRELVVEVGGHALSLDEAATKFSAIARPIANMIGFVANVRVGPIEAHLAYDCDPNSEERQFLEVFLPDERGSLAEGRIVRQHLLAEACPAFLALPAESARVGRALRQYELALREWYIGGEWLALSHLWMAVETLTEAVLRRTLIDRGITERELAQSLGVATNDPDRPRWGQIMREQVREQVIFAGDSDTYKTAKTASDGLEHGYLDLDKVAAHALKSADKTFHHVRRVLVELIDLPSDIADELMTIKPMDSQSRRKVIRGRLLGAAEDPAEEGEMYPRLEWISSIDSIAREGSTFQMKGKEQVTVRTHPAVSFSFDSIEVVGRLEEGEVPVEFSDQDITIEPMAGADSAKLLNAVMPLVDAAAASGAQVRHNTARMFAFNLLGQGIAFFQSAQTLIASFQPVEALPSLRGLTLIAARYEQMADPDGPGLGIVVRMALDGLNEIGADPEHTEEARRHVLESAGQLGIFIPQELGDPETTAIYRSLIGEMTFAKSATEATYGAVGLHLKPTDDEHLGFHTKLEPGHFTNMVATACVLAQMDLLKRAANLFGWTVDAEKVAELINEARQLNDSSAARAD